jgi:hypothetical protein
LSKHGGWKSVLICLSLFASLAAHSNVASKRAFIYVGKAPEKSVDYTATSPPKKPQFRTFHYSIFSDVFGFGEAWGTEITQASPFPDRDSRKLYRSSTLRIQFQDRFPFRTFQGDATNVIFNPDVTLNRWPLELDTVADGIISDFDTSNQQVVPLTSSYFLKHEAGTKDMLRWLGEDDTQVKRRRARFVAFLKDEFGLLFPDDLLDSEVAASVNNEVAGITPYSAAHNSEFRIIASTSAARADEPFPAPSQFEDRRVIEVGFKYDSPQGLIKQGST